MLYLCCVEETPAPFVGTNSQIIPKSRFFSFARILFEFRYIPNRKTSWFYKLIQCTNRKTGVQWMVTWASVSKWPSLASLQGICIENSSPSSNESLSRTRLFCREATRRRKLGVGLICRYFQIFRPIWLSSRVTCVQLSQYAGDDDNFYENGNDGNVHLHAGPGTTGGDVMQVYMWYILCPP